MEARVASMVVLATRAHVGVGQPPQLESSPRATTVLGLGVGLGSGGTSPPQLESAMRAAGAGWPRIVAAPANKAAPASSAAAARARDLREGTVNPFRCVSSCRMTGRWGEEPPRTH